MIKHSALLCYTKTSDAYCNFTVEVVDSNKIRLIADNGTYCKRFRGWKDKDIVIMDFTQHDLYSDFIVVPITGNTIRLKDDTGRFLKRFFSFEDKSIIISGGYEPDDYFNFRLDKLPATNAPKEVVERIDFDQSQLRKRLSPFQVGSMSFPNNSKVSQTMNFIVRKVVSTTKSFEWSNSFTLGATVGFKCEVPLAEVEGIINVENTFTKGGSESTTEEETIESTFPLICEPMTTTTAVANVNLGKVDVPYNATIRRVFADGREYRFQVNGVFHGTSAFDVTYVVDSEPLLKK